MKTSFYFLAKVALLFIVLNANSQQMAEYTQQVFPVDHALNTRIDLLPVHPNSANFVTGIGNEGHLHPDFGTEWSDNGTIYQIGIPYNVVDANQPLVPITFSPWGDESDPGPWPIPANPYIETVSDWRETDNGDRHMLIINEGTQMLYETGNTFGNADGTEWTGGAGAIWDLTSNALRPETWTSADAAGLPIFPLLIRYDEVERAVATGGEIPHALRFTVVHTQKAYIWPARHYASSSTNPDYPPMGLRFRLKADFDISGFTPRVQVILRTMKKYGLIVSDNGSNWFIQGTHDDRWDDDEIGALKSITGNNFEAVDISSWSDHPDFDPNSAAVPEEAVNAMIRSETPAGFYIYPNPAQDIIKIFNEKQGVSVVKIYSIQGQICLENKFSGNAVEINISSLTSGTYIIELRNADCKINQMIIKN